VKENQPRSALAREHVERHYDLASRIVPTCRRLHRSKLAEHVEKCADRLDYRVRLDTRDLGIGSGTCGGFAREDSGLLCGLGSFSFGLPLCGGSVTSGHRLGVFASQLFKFDFEVAAVQEDRTDLVVENVVDIRHCAGVFLSVVVVVVVVMGLDCDFEREREPAKASSATVGAAVLDAADLILADARPFAEFDLCEA
jgi:hypothetical protein